MNAPTIAALRLGSFSGLLMQRKIVTDGSIAMEKYIEFRMKQLTDETLAKMKF